MIDTPKRTRKKVSPWRIGRRAYRGIDTWSGRHSVTGFCAIYEVTELNDATGEVRTSVERGEARYLNALPADVAAIFAAYCELSVALRRHAEAK